VGTFRLVSSWYGGRLAALCEFGPQGLAHDDEFGLIYNRRRYLSPSLASFIQRDPAGYVDGMNLYNTDDSNPTSARDPFGMQSGQENLGGVCETLNTRELLEPQPPAGDLPAGSAGFKRTDLWFRIHWDDFRLSDAASTSCGCCKRTKVPILGYVGYWHEVSKGQCQCKGICRVRVCRLAYRYDEYIAVPLVTPVERMKEIVWAPGMILKREYDVRVTYAHCNCPAGTYPEDRYGDCKKDLMRKCKRKAAVIYAQAGWAVDRNEGVRVDPYNPVPTYYYECTDDLWGFGR